MKSLNPGRSQIPPIHRQVLIRKYDLWSRKQAAVPPKFLDVLTDDSGVMFELPIDVVSIQAAREMDKSASSK